VLTVVQITLVGRTAVAQGGDAVVGRDSVELHVHVVPINRRGAPGSAASALRKLLDTSNADLRAAHMRPIGVIVRFPVVGGILELQPRGWIPAGDDSGIVPFDASDVTILDNGHVVIAVDGRRDTVKPEAVVMLNADRAAQLSIDAKRRDSILVSAFQPQQVQHDALRTPDQATGDDFWKNVLGNSYTDPGNSGARTYYISIRVPLRLFSK